MVGVGRSIVVEYRPEKLMVGDYNKIELRPVLERIISWKNDGGKLSWKEIKCPQSSFPSIKGYYNTMGLPVVFFNKSSNAWSKSPPN